MNIHATYHDQHNSLQVEIVGTYIIIPNHHMGRIDKHVVYWQSKILLFYWECWLDYIS